MAFGVVGSPQDVSASLTGADPAAFNVTVAGNRHILQWAYYNSTDGTGAGTFTLNGVTPDNSHEVTNVGDASACGTFVWNDIAVGTRELDGQWDGTPGEGPTGWFTNVDDAGNALDLDSATAESTTAVEVTLGGLASGNLVIKMQMKFDSGTVPPGTSGGWTSLGVTASAHSGEWSRVESITASGASQACPAEDEYYSAVTAVAFPGAAFAELSGTASETIDEDDIVAGGKTVVVTLTDETFVDNGFPVVEGVAESSVNTAGTSHAVTLPANIVASDLVLIIMDIGSTSATLNALTDWAESLDENVANGLKILRYTGSGVPSNPTFTSSASTRSASIAYRISNADKSIAPQIGTTATGTSATPNPPSVTPTGGTSKKYLFIAFFGQAGEEADDDTWVNTPPTNYTPSPPRQKACGTAGTSLGGKIGAAERQLETGSAQDPGTFGVDVSAAWRAQTIIIHPAFAFDDARAAIRSGMDSAQSEGTGWDARLSTIVPLNNIVRTSDTVVTITLAADASYNISSQELITVTVPGSALVGGSPLVADPSFTIDEVSAGIVEDMNQASETNDSQPISKIKVKAMGQVVESNDAQAIARAKAKTFAQASETNTAQAIVVDVTKVRTVNQAAETNDAQTFTSAKVKVFGQAQEEDAASIISPDTSKVVTLNQASEADAVFAVTSAKAKTFDQAEETNDAQAFGRTKARTLNQTAENDSAFQITPLGAIVLTMAQVAELNAVQQIIWAPKTRQLNPAAESNSAFGIAHAKSKTMNQVVESNLAGVMLRIKLMALLQVAELDQATQFSLSFAYTPHEERALLLVEANRLALLEALSRLAVFEARNRLMKED